MELKLEVVLSSSIKRKKPWPRFCWLGQEKESVFLLDDKRISEINMVSGRTKKRTPKLHHLLNSVVTMSASQNGIWLCGLLASGELFLWNKDKDLLKTATAALEVVQMITSTQGNSMKVSLQVSWDGRRVLVVGMTGLVFLWECMDMKDLTGLRDGPLKGLWVHIQPLEDTILPFSRDKEASQHTIFLQTEVLGDTCLSAFVFTSGKNLVVTFLKVQWEEGPLREGSVGYSIQWATKTYPMSQLTPSCTPVKSRGALVPAFSPDGRLLAIVLNQKKPKATQVLFVSTKNFVSVSSDLGGCGSKTLEIPSKYIRSYWVGSVSWSPGGLFLTCVLKRGSLLMLTRLGGLLTLTSSGCNVDFGPAQFLPLHPLVTYRPPVSARNAEASLSSSSLSVRDIMRQRYSVTWHPRLFYLIVSDGYMATVIRVLDRPSPGLLLRALLKDTSKDLEKATQMVDKSQIHTKAWLESVSCLYLESSLEEFSSTVTGWPNTTDSVISAAPKGSTLPLFLQDQRTLGGTKELFESVQAFFEENSDLEGLPSGSNVEDNGRLEFASMFDTIHALDTHTDTTLVPSPECDNFSETERKPLLHRHLRRIQRKLLTAWAFAMSLGNSVEHRGRLLKYTLRCVVRFAALLHLIPNPAIHSGENDTTSKLLRLIKALLSFLPWDSTPSDGPCCLGLVVEFSKHLIRLLLTPHPENYQTSHSPLSSQSLSQALLVLQMVSDSLDNTYNLQQRSHWSSAKKETSSQQLWLSDAHHVPLLQDDDEEQNCFVQNTQAVLQQPSTRLLGVYRMVYNIALQYMEELKSFTDCDGWQEEAQQLAVIVSQIQTALQATGERLEEGPSLLSYPGEHLFLCGSYPKSAETWRLQICENSNKSWHRTAFQETRLCLALLYSLLSQYNLREAQELGDHMAQLILHRTGHQKDNATADSLPCPWLPIDLQSEAACAVIQTLGRFMASFFTNQPLYILPPHSVAVLPPLHFPHAPGFGRLVPLSQEEVTRAVRQQHLSEVWTVDYAKDLLLLGGLLPEAVWLAYHLGDWKTAVSIGLAYTSYCTGHFDFTRLRGRELHLPAELEPESIFQTELECLLGDNNDSREQTNKDEDKSFTDPLEGEDRDLLHVSIQEILKASVIAGVNVMSSPVSSLLDTAKDLCSTLPTLVSPGLYLPSPPLYCPQPSPNTQDQIGTTGQFAEVVCRQKVSKVLQRLLLLLRSGHCCHPAAQWYISHLRRARHLLYKIKKKYAYPSATEEEKTFPEGLMKFTTPSGHFKRGPHKDGLLDPGTIQIIICFRELCGLCWMLHVRDQLSISCRRYQSARQRSRDEQISNNSEVNSACADALRWACRFLPFSHFFNAEEVLQDLLLSLVSELPPLSLVADTLVRAFPQEEESVRVSLREKYNSLLRQLTQCHVLEEENEEESELMMILIQDKFRQRKKHLGRLRRHLGPTVLHLWEKEEEEEDKGIKHGMAVLRQLSMGTSLSTSTLTDCGFPPVCSDGDTAENTSVAISPEQQRKALNRVKGRKKSREHVKKTAVKIESVIQEEGPKENEGPALPVVGTWEFEVEDEEYLKFLELFLSYVLEKDSTAGGDVSTELPLLKAFCSKIRERELHSLTFDVLTTIHRRQRDGHHTVRKHSANDPPVFRAGCCYKPIKQDVTPELHTSSICSEAPIFRPSSQPVWSTGKQKGLFGLQQRSIIRGKENVYGSERKQRAFTTDQASESFMSGTSVTLEAVTELQQGLDPKLEAQFPKLGRLLEWMVRWADRRVLLGHSKKKNDKGGRGGGRSDGVVIRVKASAPAILTSLGFLEERYTALLGTGCYSAHIQVPQQQWTVAPVLQPETDKKLERESSIDTGYPGSANTPVAGLDHNPHQEELSVSGFHTDEPEELTFHETPLPPGHDQMAFDAQANQLSLQPLSLEDLDVTPEKEGSGSEAMEASSSCSSESLSGNICTPEASLKLADAHCSEKAQDLSSSSFLHSYPGSPHTPPQQQSPAPPIIQPKPTGDANHSKSNGILIPDTTANPPRIQSHSSTPIMDSTIPNEPSTTQAPPVRQHLGDDLFRLIQHINYMSLREVLQASFSTVQLSQQSACLVQSNTIYSHSSNLIPEPNVFPLQPSISASPQTHTCVPNVGSNNPQVSQTPECRLTPQPAMPSSVKTSSAGQQVHTNMTLPPNVSDADVRYQEKPLSVQAGSPPPPFRGSRRWIPSSQGLLATTDSSHSIHSSPVLPPSNGTAQNDSATQLLGLKLLQLQPSLLPQHSTPQYPPPQPTRPQQTANSTTLHHQPYTLIHNKQTNSMRQGVEGKGMPSASKRQLSFNPPANPTPTNPQPPNWPLEKCRVQESSLLPPVLPAHTTLPVQGLRLLYLQPASQSNITFPKLPLPSTFRPSTVITAPVGKPPVIKLLHIESRPKMMLPVSTPSTPVVSLMSMEDLTRSVFVRRNAEETQPQLLRLHPSSESTMRATPSSSLNSKKRLKRREEKARKTEVKFRPNDSIIPTQQQTDVPVCEQPAVAEEVTSTQDISVPIGSFESLLTGQRLLDNVASTSAELHAFASTCKRPPECHDAFTNTNPACPVLVDKGISAQDSFLASSPKGQSLMSFPKGNENTVQDTKKLTKEPENRLDPGERQFISVLDLEDMREYEHLPASPGQGSHESPSVRPPSPTSADLHVLATAVLRSGSSAATSRPSVTIPEDILKRNMLPDNPEESFSDNGPSMVSDKTALPQDNFTSDPSDSEICRAIRIQSTEPHRASSSPSTVWFSSRMSELDTQLAALQNIADQLENDFSNSRMLVETIENHPHPSGMVSEVKKATIRKTVRLSVPQKGSRFNLDLSTEAHALEEENENENLHSHRLGRSSPHTPPRIKDLLTQTDGIRHAWAEENLGQSELSDTAEILDELVKEGYLSPTDLDFSTLKTAQNSSRPAQPESSRMSQNRVLPEDERRELRIWMRRKQREKLAVYQKHRESLRERESKPFSPCRTVQSKNQNQKTTLTTKEQKEKITLLEQYNQRTREACSIAKDALTTSANLRSCSQTDRPSLTSTARPTSAPPYGSTYSVAANDKRSLKFPSGQTLPDFHPQSFEVQEQPSLDHRRRLGLHRPVTVLPKDLLSQVTRRGMITDTKRHIKLHTASHSEERRVGPEEMTGLNKTFTRGRAVGKGITREQVRDKEKEEIVPSELTRHRGQQESITHEVLMGLLEEDDDGQTGASGMDWLDNLSGSAGSSLSKIDWAAIERLVAEEEV